MSKSYSFAVRVIQGTRILTLLLHGLVPQWFKVAVFVGTLYQGDLNLFAPVIYGADDLVSHLLSVWRRRTILKFSHALFLCV